MGQQANSTQDPAQSNIPVPIQLAKQALIILATEKAELAASLQKKLPGFAMQQAREGVELTVEYLFERAKNNELDKTVAPKQRQKTYEEIIAQLFPQETAVIEAAARGDVAEIKRLKKEGADIHWEDDLAFVTAARNGHLNVVKYYTTLMDRQKKLGDENKDSRRIDTNNTLMVTVLRHAMARGQRDVEDYLVNEKGLGNLWRAADPDWALDQAAYRNDFEGVKYLVEERGANNGWALKYALQRGHIEIADYLFDRPFYAEAITEVLEWAARENNVASLKFLIEKKGVDVHMKNDYALFIALNYDLMKATDYLMPQGKVPRSQSTRKKLEEYRAQRDAWQKVARTEQPYECLGKEDPAYYRPKAFKAVSDMLKEEGADYWDRMTLHASALFGTEDRVLQYLEKHGQPTEQPLHDIIHMIKLPARKTSEMNLAAWGDAVLKCGPSMARLVKFADRLSEPLKSDDGQTWSMQKTRNAVAEFAYKRAKENLELAALCLEHAVEEHDFNKALELAKTPVPEKKIPDVRIDGADFGMEGASFHRLEPGDIRGLFLGEITDCCQSIGHEGEQCARNGFTSADAGFYVVENSRSKIVGQTWAWRGEGGELVFDSLETLGRNVTPKQWRKLSEEFGKALAKKPDNDVTALHIGTGGATASKLIRKFSEASSPAEPRNGYHAYRDSHRQVVVWHGLR